MKNFLTVVLLLTTLLSCRKDLPVFENETTSINKKLTDKKNTASRLASHEKVKLYKAWSSYGYVYHGAYSSKRYFYVEVANIAYGKKVFVHHKMLNGSWQNFPLQYDKTSDNNAEIWKLELDLSSNFGSTIAPPQLGEEFAIFYEVNGQVYWDNNRGNNYKMSATSGMYLQDGLHISNDVKDSYFAYYPNTYASQLNVVVDVRNLGYEKKVTLVYSTDRWRTTKYAPMQFALYYSIGSGSSLISPNQFGIERWRINLPVEDISMSRVEYAVSYKVNGTEYWDNNYGRNYRMLLARY